MLTIRPAQWPQDIQLVSSLDTTFVTDRVYRAVREDMSFRLVEESVSPALRKTYDVDPAERQDWHYTAIAEVDGKFAGFAAAQYQGWNRRVAIWHVYVAQERRGAGVGTRLLEALDGFAQSKQARCLWLETQNVNHPAIGFYLHAGFRFCGFDESLYDAKGPASDEIALFFARPVTTSKASESGVA